MLISTTFIDSPTSIKGHVYSLGAVYYNIMPSFKHVFVISANNDDAKWLRLERILTTYSPKLVITDPIKNTITLIY